MSDLHPDDEALSAHLDDPEPRLRVHLDGCATCTARLEELQRVRTLLGAPVPPPPARLREAAIARALDAGGHGAGSRRRAGTWAGGIAAATLLVLGAAFGLSQLSNRDGNQLATTGAKVSAPASEAGDQAGTSAGPATATEVSELGDLGALTDTAALRALVQPTLAQLDAGAPPAAERAAPDANQQFRSGAKQATVRRCADAARALDPANLRPAAAGIATWQGTPAEVFVYAVEGRPGAARVYVLARSDCRVLEFQSYAP